MKIPLHPSCPLLTSHVSGLIAVDKAPGILSHPNPGDDRSPALLNAEYDSAEEVYRSEGGDWYLLNRLDAPTSGVILLADNPGLAKAVKAAFADHTVEKVYIALVKGIPPRREEVWRDALSVQKRGGVLRTSVSRGKPNTVCRMELTHRGYGPPARALLTLFPETGRTHQLRVQCAARRLPIIGDATYGDFAFNRQFRKRTGEDRLFLHCLKTRLSVRIGTSTVSFSAESRVPEAFTVALA